MTNKPLRILSINPGSKYLGIAVFLGTELRDWAIRVVNGKDARLKATAVREIVLDYVDRYGINVFALKRLHPSRSSQAVRNLSSEIKKAASKHKLALCELSIDEVKSGLLSQVRGNKCLLMEEIVVRYPFLFHELEREQKNKNPYLIRMFEAVGLGIVCFSKLDSGNSKVARMIK
jgi:hypothetical protein